MASTVGIKMDFQQVVPLKNIESALASVLDDLQGKNKTRACLFNLLIYSKENTREKYIQTIIQKIVQRFPCRILLFINKGPEHKEIQSTISVIEISQGGSQVFCDCIQFDLSSNDLKQISFLTLPHLMPDLPTFSLWAEDPSKDDPYLLHFETFCSRMIFDSEVSDSLVSFSKNLLKYQVMTGINLADLNWARTESFRDLFSSLFFSGRNTKKLDLLNHLAITYNQVPSTFFCHTKIQAIYIALWIASKLQLTLKSSSNDTLIFNNKEREVKINLIAGSHPDVTAGRILVIELDLENSEHYLFKRKDKKPNTVVIYRTEKDICEIPSEFLLDAEDSGASLVGEVFHHQTSPSFLKVLNMIAHQQIEDFCT